MLRFIVAVAVVCCFVQGSTDVVKPLEHNINSTPSSFLSSKAGGGGVEVHESGEAVFDYDEMPPMPVDAVDMIFETLEFGPRATWDPKTPLWPKGQSGLYEVPFYVDTGVYSEFQINTILLAIRILERSTNLKFIRLSEEDRVFVYHVLFTGGTGCSAHVGYQIEGQSNGYQEIILAGPGTAYACRTLEMVLHEILHALGMGHEHQRSDRDQYVTVVAHGGDYDIVPSLATDTPYDLASLMQFRYNKEAIYANDPNMTRIQSATGPTPTSCDYHWINTKYPGEKPAPPCEPNVVMRQCEPLPEFQGIQKYEDYCYYNCGFYAVRQTEDQTAYCKFITDDGTALPIDAVTEYMKTHPKTTTTTPTESPTTVSTDPESVTTHESSRSKCCVLPEYLDIPNFQEWCNRNDCNDKYCFVNNCKPKDEYSDMPHIQKWCDDNDCPPSYCVSAC